MKLAAMIDLIAHTESGDLRVRFLPRRLIIAGWTGRDLAALEAHIAELEAIGVPRPKETPVFYRVSPALLTTAPVIHTAGRDATGEVEAVLWKHEGVLFVGVGSDHTDRVIETVGVTVSKQICAKPVSADVWLWSEVSTHWEQMIARSVLLSEDALYQEGGLNSLRRPDELVALYEQRYGPFTDGDVMFCGTQPVHGGLRFSPVMQLELEDPVRGRALRHEYRVEDLPIVER